MLKITSTCFAAFIYIIACSLFVTAQTTTPITFGLEKPTEIISAGQKSLIVSEAGTNTPNNGRISLVDRKTGVRRTLVEGLPSALSQSGGPPTPSGPSGLKLDGRNLYLTIGQGDVAVPDGMGNETPNFLPSSQLFNSVLELKLPADYEELMSAWTLTETNQKILSGGGIVMLMNTEGKLLEIRLVANLPDYKFNKTIGQGLNSIRPSNVFGVEVVNDQLYIVDASFNMIYKVDKASGIYSRFAVFPPKPNPLPFGPPTFESVPDSIKLVGDKLLVSNLTGFPFPQGFAEVQTVDLETGSLEPFIGGLTSAIDVLPLPLPGDNDLYFVLEFSANMLGNPSPPGRLKLYTSAGATPIELANDLISPTGMTLDTETGDIFVTEIFPGRIIKIRGSEIAEMNIAK